MSEEKERREGEGERRGLEAKPTPMEDDESSLGDGEEKGEEKGEGVKKGEEAAQRVIDKSEWF